MIRRVDQLAESHHGRECRTPAVTGTLVGIVDMPSGAGRVLVLTVGGSRAFTDTLAGDVVVELGPKPKRGFA